MGVRPSQVPQTSLSVVLHLPSETLSHPFSSVRPFNPSCSSDSDLRPICSPFSVSLQVSGSTSDLSGHSYLPSDPLRFSVFSLTLFPHPFSVSGSFSSGFQSSSDCHTSDFHTSLVLLYSYVYSSFFFNSLFSYLFLSFGSIFDLPWISFPGSF